MNKIVSLSTCLLLTACMSLNKPTTEPAHYDFGSAHANPTMRLPENLVSAEISAPTWLANKDIHYRLAYKAPERVYAYAQSQWVAQPAELLARRLGQTLAGVNINAYETRTLAGCLLDIHLDDFEQVFSTPTESAGRIRLQVVLSHRASGQRLLQADFTASKPAATADAHGGVVALSAAGDMTLHDLADWINRAFDASQPEGRDRLRLCVQPK